MLKDLFRAVAGIAIVGIALGASGCDGASITINGERGVPLSELDLSGPAPSEVALLGPDKVHITQGDKLAISVDGEEAVKSQLRFVLNDGQLGISREKWKSDKAEGVATVNVVMPAPRKLIMAGSGEIDTATFKGEEANIVVAGSGTITAPATEVGTLKLDIAGSGKVTAGGSAKKLKTTIAGSGEADFSGLRVENADVTVAGSGNMRFASDGEVKASIMGSGSVAVKGRAKCTVKSMGSGRLVCEP